MEKLKKRLGITLSQPVKSVYLINAKHTPNDYIISSTFFRLQEFFESPLSQLRGKFFTIEQGMDYYTCYAHNKKGAFTYFEDWAGFNIPGHIVRRFFDKFDHDLNEKESALYFLLEDIILSDKKFYLIGMPLCDDSSLILLHELAHAFFYLYPEYKKEMLRLNKKLPAKFRKAMRKILLDDLGYATTTVEDETQAYYATSFVPYLINTLEIPKNFDWNKIVEHQIYFDNFYGEELDDAKE